MILKAIHPKFPILKTETYVQYRIKKLRGFKDGYGEALG